MDPDSLDLDEDEKDEGWEEDFELETDGKPPQPEPAQLENRLAPFRRERIGVMLCGSSPSALPGRPSLRPQLRVVRCVRPGLPRAPRLGSLEVEVQSTIYVARDGV
jgi:hypothetical protein